MKTHLFYLIFLLFFINQGCSNTPVKESNSVQKAYQEAEELYQSGRSDEAINKFREIKNKFPHTKWALNAELAIADIYFEKENFLDAQHSYLLFKEFHPKHSKTPYVTFQLAMSYFKQLPSSVGRDLSSAQKAIPYFDQILRLYPHSQYIKKSKEKKRAALKMLAAKEFYIAQFYFKQKKWLSALNRYDGLLREHSLLGFNAKSLKGASLAAAHLGKKQKSLRFWKQLKTSFPKSNEALSTESELKHHGIL